MAALCEFCGEPLGPSPRHTETIGTGFWHAIESRWGQSRFCQTIEDDPVAHLVHGRYHEATPRED